MDRIEEIVQEAAARLRELEPDAIAVVLAGSHARGTADEHSDLDVRAITSREPRLHYRTWFAEQPAGNPIHVSLGAHSLAYWLAARREPAWWTLGFATVYHAAYVWATPEARAQLGADPSIVRPPGSPHLEGFVEGATKVRRAGGKEDVRGTHFYARKLAEATPRAENVERAARRLTREVLAFLRERKPDVDPQPDLSRYLADGTLERHLGFVTD